MSTKNRKLLRFCLSIAALFAILCTTVFATGGTAAFTDVSGHWAESYIQETYDRQLTEGYNGKYRPDDSMTRAEMVTILWRAMGRPQPSGAATFTDLTQDWYKDAVAWAEENKVVNGVAPGKFGPDVNVTRQQLAAVLFRLSGGTSGMELLFTSLYDEHFTDEDSIADYAKAATYWCIFNEVYCGPASEKVGDTIAPTADATRGQIAVMIIRYLDRNN